MKPIFLIGYMGVGKSAVGKVLARKLGVEHIDLDHWIEQRFRSRICDMFASVGEERFRKREMAMLEEVAGIENVVISVGGGTPCFFQNMQLMNDSGLTVYLKCAEDVIVKRISSVHSSRPLLKDKSQDELHEFVKRHLKERKQYYEQAAYTIDVSDMDVGQVVAEFEGRILLNYIK